MIRSRFIVFGLALALSLPVWAQNEPMISLDFHDVDIQDVIKSISEITGKNFVIGDGVRGKVTIISPSPVTVPQAYEAFLSALSVKKLCASESGAVIKILPLRECSSAPTPFSFGEDDEYSGDQFVTKLIALKYVDANEIRQVLNSMVGRRETIVAHGPTNSLILSGSGANIQRLEKLIQRLDEPKRAPTVEVISLKYAQADVVAQKLLSIFHQQKATASKRRRSDDVEGGASVTKIIPDTRTNSIIVEATRDGLERVLDLLAEMDREVKVAVDRNRLHVRPLRHAKAEDLSAILASLVSGQSGAGAGKDSSGKAMGAKKGESQVSTGSGAIIRSSAGMFEQEVRIVADPSTNSLVITASPNDYASIAPIIDQLDSRRAQVFVETLIMEVNITKGMAVGFSAHGAGADAQGNSLFGSTNLGGPSSLAASQDPKTLAGIGGLMMGARAGKAFNIGGLSIPAFGSMFRAQQESGIFNVLSAPTILTTDNKKAEIHVGEEVPFLESTQMSTGGTENKNIVRKKVGIQLAVTPHIGEGDSVTLEIEQKIASVIEQKGEALDLRTSDREAKTTVVSNSGQTVVIGGLITDEETKSVNKVPLLGDIPLLGYLFRETSTKHEKKNLVIFLTPHVIQDPSDMTRISVKKNNERRKFNKKHGIPENQALYDYDLDKGLDMAPHGERRTKKKEKTRRRFDYNRPQSDGAGSEEVEKELAARRKRSSSKGESGYANFEDGMEDVAERPFPRRRGGQKSQSGNPFSDVRPPSSE